jgi:hypothetical protein
LYTKALEIYEYFNGFAKNALHESTAKWKVQIQDVQGGRAYSDDCDILVNASGILNA